MGDLSSEEECCRKKGGSSERWASSLARPYQVKAVDVVDSLSTRVVLETSLFDLSNHLSALLLSPELSLQITGLLLVSALLLSPEPVL